MTRESASALPTPKKAFFRTSLPVIWAWIRPYRWTLLVSGILITVSQVGRVTVPYSTRYLMDVVVRHRRLDRLPWLILAVFLGYLVYVLCFYNVAQLMNRTSERIMAELRKRTWNRMVHLPVEYFDSNLSGALVSRIMRDIDEVRSLVGRPMLDLVAALVTMCMVVGTLWRRSWPLTLLELAVNGAAVYIISRTFKAKVRMGRESGRIYGELSGRLTESINGIRVVKGYRAEERASRNFADLIETAYRHVMRVRTVTSLESVLGLSMVSLTTLLLMYFGGRLMIADRWTVGDFVQYQAMLVYLIGPIQQLANLAGVLSLAVAALEHVQEVLAKRVEEDDPERTAAIAALTGEVRTEDLSFCYEPDRPVLHDIAFTALPDTVTALVGPSGAGKSTLISLLSAFYKPTSGRILIDGVDLNTATLDSYRSQLGLVLQETFLFDGTIRENVLFSRPEAGEDEFLDTCRMARVGEFAERFPKGYETIVGERGVKLSGGQRQRISIARAILANPRILILDEATSSLDSESEAMIQEGLSYLMQGRTTFVIAHRLSTIRRADQILVLEDGRILERGTHESLYKAGGRYYELYTKQYGLEIDPFQAQNIG